MSQFVAVHPEDPLARPVIDGLADEYARLYGARADGELTAREVEDFLPPRGVLLVLVEDGVTVAGGALAPLRPGVAEVKRMWTAPSQRCRGLARRMLAELECRAAGLGYDRLRLQTGALQAPAIALYRTAGYEIAPPFGRYRDEPLAVGFAKRVAVPAGC